MNLALDVVCGAIAYRIARLITVDSITSGPRMAVMKRFGMTNTRPARPHRATELVSCPICMSVWTAAAVAGWLWGWGYLGGWRDAAATWWVGAAVACFAAVADRRMTA